MNKSFKVTLWCIMITALSCGFLHHLIPSSVLNFERLHIFLFNLVSGGTLLVYFTENTRTLSRRGLTFLLLSLLFAFCAFMEWYGPTLVIPLILSVIIELVRIDHFGNILPKELFSEGEPTSRKFHQASLLCLSCGLVISSLAIVNSEYTHWFTLEKLTLDTFFLGFSFPISLISMSVIFALMKNHSAPLSAFLKEISFWTINLGVIIFFLFILANWFIPQVIISTILFFTVSLVLYLYLKQGIRLQQKSFLTSGIVFLVITSITGILYIFLEFSDSYTHESALPLLRMHAFTALYGWNLSGLAVISRHGDFPIRLHSQKVIILHWVTVLILCPLGYFYPLPAFAAVICYGYLLYTLLFNHGRVDVDMVEAEDKVLQEELI
ncbi:MAG: hypothetical protein ACI8PB_003766 [Desulforhopalus sp.]